jgi:hypothetical protein
MNELKIKVLLDTTISIIILLLIFSSFLEYIWISSLQNDNGTTVRHTEVACRIKW